MRIENRRFTRLANGFSDVGKASCGTHAVLRLLQLLSEVQKLTMHPSYGSGNHKACLDLKDLLIAATGVYKARRISKEQLVDRNRKSCPNCNGSGRLKCMTCFGMRRKSVLVPVTKHVFRLGKYETDISYEYQSQPCDSCSGLGWQMCLACVGTGLQ